MILIKESAAISRLNQIIIQDDLEKAANGLMISSMTILISNINKKLLSIYEL